MRKGKSVAEPEISPERFDEIFGRLCDLMGWRMSENRTTLIYEEVMDFGPDDLGYACRVMRDEFKFSMNRFLVLLRENRAKRLEARSHREKQEEEREIRALFSESKRDGCVNDYQCTDCERSSYCYVIGKAAIKGLFEMVDGTKTVVQIEAELGQKFPGMGWPEPEIEPF